MPLLFKTWLSPLLRCTNVIQQGLPLSQQKGHLHINSVNKWTRSSIAIIILDQSNFYNREGSKSFYNGEEASFFSLIASWTDFRTDGINCLFVAMMPVSRSRYLPFEKSRSFPEASLTTPPASGKHQKNGSKKCVFFSWVRCLKKNTQ